jgi:hypothetical protein
VIAANTSVTGIEILLARWSRSSMGSPGNSARLIAVQVNDLVI